MRGADENMANIIMAGRVDILTTGRIGVRKSGTHEAQKLRGRLLAVSFILYLSTSLGTFSSNALQTRSGSFLFDESFGVLDFYNYWKVS